MLLAALLLSVCLQTAAASRPERQEGDIPEGWRLVPRVGICLEYGGFAFQKFDYVSRLKRQVEIDLLQFRRHIFYMKFDENTYFGVPGSKWEFNVMKFNAILAGYRYDFGNFYLGLFLHHQCNNIFLTRTYHEMLDRERANIYDLGVEFLTKNLRVGMKNRNINFAAADDFEFLHRFAAGFWASRALTADRIYLRWLLKAQVRYDILRYRRLIPYVEATAEALLGQESRLVPTAEVGLRWHLSDRVDLTPFCQWSRAQLALTTSFVPEQSPYFAYDYFYAGVRLETLLDRTSPKNSLAGSLQFLPEVHGQAGYSFFLDNPDFNGRGDIRLYFHALQWRSWTVFLDTNMHFNTRHEDLKPDKVSYSLEYGLTHYWPRGFLEGFVRNQVRLDSNLFRGTTEQGNLAGLRAGTRGIKPGYEDFGLEFDHRKTFEWLNNWQGQAGVGHYFRNRDWNYLWDLMLQVRWDVCRVKFIIPYLQGEVNWRTGGNSVKDAWEYAVEPGLRFRGVFDFAVFYRFQRLKNNLTYPSPYQNQNLIGVKVLF